MTVFSLTWLPEVLEIAGLKVAEVPGWRSRGRAEMGKVRGVMLHHTADSHDGNMPTLQMLVDGRSDLPGPLCQLGLGRDGTFYVVAAGRANHAGVGIWEEITTGNSSFIGIEAEHSGKSEDPWPSVQKDAYQRGVAAILRRIGASANMCCGHKEYAPKRKIDPTFDMPEFRSVVSDLLVGKSPLPPIPATDGKNHQTLRRGMRGPEIMMLQRKIGIDPDGIFGADTEAALRVEQRTAGLVPDGIAGPKTWAVLPGEEPPGAPLDGQAPDTAIPENAGVAVPARKIGTGGIDLIKYYEHCETRRPDGTFGAYPDPGSKDGLPWTIGWGSTGDDVTPASIWTQQECDDRFEADLEKYAAQVSHAIGSAPTTQNQFDAMVSFHYNTGAITTATLTKRHVARDYNGAREAFAWWNKNNGQVMRGLALRRAAESALYTKPDGT